MKYYHYKKFILLIVVLFIAQKSFSKEPATKNEKPLVVIIDPGHGGKDPGAVNKSIREKDIVLAIGLKLGKLINESYSDVKVIYTRSTDIFIPLIERSRIANKNKADLFISIHANSGGAPSTRGTETFVLGLHRSSENLEVAKKENSVILLEEDYKTTYEGFDPNLSESYIMFELVQDIYMDQSLQFASAIQNQFTSRLETPNRGVKQAGLLVLRQSSMPSVLVEAGFLSSQTEANFLNSSDGQQSIAVSIFEAFRKFKSKNSTVTTGTLAEKQSAVESKQINAEATSKQEIKEIVKEPAAKEKPQETVTAVKEDSMTEKKDAGKTEINSQVEKPSVTKPVQQLTKNETQTQPAPPKETNAYETTAIDTYYSVQIGANTIPMEPVAANFKGLKEVRREKTDKYYRYYVGKEVTLDKITEVWQQVKIKFPQSFLVSFSGGKRTIIDNKAKP